MNHCRHVYFKNKQTFGSTSALARKKSLELTVSGCKQSRNTAVDKTTECTETCLSAHHIPPPSNCNFYLWILSNSSKWKYLNWANHQGAEAGQEVGAITINHSKVVGTWQREQAWWSCAHRGCVTDKLMRSGTSTVRTPSSTWFDEHSSFWDLATATRMKHLSTGSCMKKLLNENEETGSIFSVICVGHLHLPWTP